MNLCITGNVKMKNIVTGTLHETGKEKEVKGEKRRGGKLFGRPWAVEYVLSDDWDAKSLFEL